MNVSGWVGSTSETRSFIQDVCMVTPGCSRRGCQFGPGWRSNSAMSAGAAAGNSAARLRFAGPAPIPTAV
jgi:hypothetical protein